MCVHQPALKPQSHLSQAFNVGFVTEDLEMERFLKISPFFGTICPQIDYFMTPSK